MIERIDHIVFTVADVAATCAFYERVLGMKVETFGEGRTALCCISTAMSLSPRPRRLRRGVRISV
jgi:catechol 2,3-dioxygenase-like lactoylglutathione lyase family enzyme